MAVRNPPITVLMSCYNAERWLAESIESVLAQSFGDFEFVIVDDGSTDSTLSIIEQYALRDERIRFIRKANTGLADSLNCGIGLASGKWIARIDADDVCEPNRLENQIAYASRYQDIVFVGTGCLEIDDAGNVIKVHRYPQHHRRLLRRLKHCQAFPPHSSAFIRAEAVKKIGGYRTVFRRSQDWDLWLRLSECGLLACIPEPLVRIRKHGGQVSLERGGKQQIVDSCAAIVSYIIRCGGGRDPLDGNIYEVNAFLSWLESRLEEEKVFALRRVWNRARDITITSENSIMGLVRATLKILDSRIGIAALWERLWGSKICFKLAKEFSNKKNVRNSRYSVTRSDS